MRMNIIADLAVLQISMIVSCCCYSLDMWLSEIIGLHTKSLITVKEHPYGRRFLRGFPKGACSTILFQLFPITNAEEYRTLEFSDGLLNATITESASAQNSYHNYMMYVQKRFCTTDGGSPWNCCFQPLRDISCDLIPNTAKKLMEILVDPIMGIPMNFLYHWCTENWKRQKSSNSIIGTVLRGELADYCPDPCYGGPCGKIQGIGNPFACDIFGPFENDYRCDCAPGYEWDQELTLCSPNNMCMNNEFPMCSIENTQRCISNGPFGTICLCKIEFMGSDCSLPRDACIEHVNKTRSNGFSKCQVNYGNQCHPVLGTDFYTCNCTEGYSSVISNEGDNCLDRLDPCIHRAANNTHDDGISINISKKSFRAISIQRNRHIFCMNGGECVPSQDFTHAACLCIENAYGGKQFTEQVLCLGLYTEHY